MTCLKSFFLLPTDPQKFKIPISNINIKKVLLKCTYDQ